MNIPPWIASLSCSGFYSTATVSGVLCQAPYKLDMVAFSCTVHARASSVFDSPDSDMIGQHVG